MKYNEFVGFRATQAERQALIAIQAAYQLPSLSAAVRAAVRQVATERALMEAGSSRSQEARYE